MQQQQRQQQQQQRQQRQPQQKQTAAAAVAQPQPPPQQKQKQQERKAQGNIYVAVYFIARFICFGLIFEERKNCTQLLRPLRQRLPNAHPTELLVPRTTTTVSTADPSRPPISRAGLTAVVSLAACVRDTTHMLYIRSALSWLKPRSAEFFPEREKTVMVQCYLEYIYVRSKLLKFETRPSDASKNTSCRAWLDQL